MREKYLAEFCGTGLLLMVVVGSGIYGETLSQGNAAVALLANSIATGCGLYVLISLLGPISGAHFNPLVSVYACVQGAINAAQCVRYVLAQVSGAVLGVWLTHFIFALPVLQTSQHGRSGVAQWTSEVVASVLLLAAIHLAQQHAKERIAMIVALLVTAGYWFTSSTFFANPAVTIARSLSDTFAGIAPTDVAGFVLAQLVGLALVLLLLLIKRARS